MRRLDKSFLCLCMVVALMSSPPHARAQDKAAWLEAERNITRLAPSAFPSLPAAIRAVLERRGCTIPQTVEFQRPHNVITGRFRNLKQRDWAVLCSRNGSSSLLVFWAGSSTSMDSLGSSDDAGFLQSLGDGSIGYSHLISVAGRKHILGYARAYQGPIPPEPIHDGIEVAFVGKVSGIRYFTGKRWIALSGAD